jgi:hypothetical protein
VTVTEPEWDADERQKMVSLAELERHVHGRCGMPLSDVIDSDSEMDPDTGRPARYQARPFPKVCHYCAARDDRVKADHEMYGARPHPQALLWIVDDLGKDR